MPHCWKSHALAQLEYLAMHKVQMYAGAINKSLYGFAYVQAMIHSLMLGLYFRSDAQTIQ